MSILQIRRATDAFIQKIPHPSHFQTPSIDFTKPRLVQISVTDVGACMPIIPGGKCLLIQGRAMACVIITVLSSAHYTKALPCSSGDHQGHAFRVELEPQGG